MHEHDIAPSLFKLTQFAREMRKAPTRSEALLWARLRNRQLGPRVRRQHILHPCIVDFYVASCRLAIEIDGSVHAIHREYDARRDAFLATTYDVRVLRIEAGLVERDVLAAVAIIRAAL